MKHQMLYKTDPIVQQWCSSQSIWLQCISDSMPICI